jgi:hypothetical protein
MEVEGGMARVMVPADVFIEGKFPAVCAKTGAPADRWLAVRANYLPGWSWLLLLFGILPFLIVAAFATQRLTGMVPVSSRAADRLRQARLFRIAAFVAALGLAVAGAVADQVWLWQLAVAFLFACVLTYLLEVAWSVGGRLDPSARWVQLTGVHRDFAASVDASTRRG